MSLAMFATDEGCEAILKYFLDDYDTVLKLFSNNVAPARGSVIGNFTEVTGGSYTEKTLTKGDWVVDEVTPRDLVYAEQTFTFTGVIGGSGKVYGCLIAVDIGDSDLLVLSSGLFSVPFEPSSSGGTLKITPKIATSNGTPG
jgi:hypothetical protein